MKDSTEFRQRFAAWKAGKKVYNAGKPVEDDYEKFKRTLPPNQRNASEYDYSTRRYWELNGKAKNFDEAVKRKMYTLEDDGFYHANSIAWTPNGDAEFMKPNVHPTKHFEDEFYESNPEFLKKYRRTFDWTRPGFSKYERNINPLDYINLPKYDTGSDDDQPVIEYYTEKDLDKLFDTYDTPFIKYNNIVPIDRDYWNSQKNDPEMRKDLTKWINELMTDNKVSVNGGELGNIVVAPTKQDKKILNLFKKTIPNKRIRNTIYEDLDILDEFEPFANKILSQNEKVRNIVSLWQMSGNPSTHNGIFDFFIRYPGSNERRPNYNPWNNSIGNIGFNDDIGALDDYLAELSHAYLFSKYAPKKIRENLLTRFLSLPGDIKINGKDGYSRPGNLEYNAHSIIEPAIQDYVQYEKYPSVLALNDRIEEQLRNAVETALKKHDNGKSIKPLAKYDGGTDDKTYLPEYEYEATVTPQGASLEKHKRITNEEDWQKYWGNVGAGHVSLALEAAAPVVLNGMSMLMGNPIGALAGIIGSEVGKSAGAQISPTAEAIGGLAGGMVLNPELWLNLPSYLRSGYNFVNHGFRGSSEILPVTGRPNTLRRFVGVGTSGLDDAVESGIIRGKTEHPVPHTAHLLTRYNKRLHEASVADDVIRRFNSGELTESDWNIVAPILNDQERAFGFKSRLLRRMPLSDSFENYQREIRNQRMANKLIQDRWDLYGPADDWSINWNGNNMATFAKYGERLSNKDIFPGDFAVEIQNADKWARDASGYGHSTMHPVSFRPIEWNNPDVTWYEKAYGLLDKLPYMRKANPTSIEAAIRRAWDRLNTYDKGKSIHINPANKGKFNATKKRTGKTTEQLAHSKNPLTRKRAIFALNSRKFKH